MGPHERIRNTTGGDGVGVRHVVWDWNGTLYDDFAVNVAAVSESCRSVGGKPVDEERYRRCYTRPITEFYERLLGRRLAPGEWDALDRCYFAAYWRQRQSCRLVQGAIEALAVVADRGLTQSLLSMWDHADLLDLVAAFELHRWFAVVQGQPRSGPAGKQTSLTRHLKTLTSKVGQMTPDDVVAIGDSLDDAAAARAVGITCVLVEHGPHHPADLVEAGVPVVRTVLEAVEVALDISGT